MIKVISEQQKVTRLLIQKLALLLVTQKLIQKLTLLLVTRKLTQRATLLLLSPKLALRLLTITNSTIQNLTVKDTDQNLKRRKGINRNGGTTRKSGGKTNHMFLVSQITYYQSKAFHLMLKRNCNHFSIELVSTVWDKSMALSTMIAMVKMERL